MKIDNKVALVTGAASGIGRAVSSELMKRGARTVVLVDRSDAVFDTAEFIDKQAGRRATVPKAGDAADDSFRNLVYDDVTARHAAVTICVPAAGITRDALAVHMTTDTGKADPYPIATFRQVTEINLIAPIYWAIEMVVRIAEDRWKRGLKRWEPEEDVQGAVVFIGSVSSQGNKGQIS
jgi:NAD(P)-dependent dehydrogenase (short-subunit alcohol dehydrogenase family)